MPKLGRGDLNWTKFSASGYQRFSSVQLNGGAPGFRKVLLKLEEPAPEHEDWNEASRWTANFRSLRWSAEAVVTSAYDGTGQVQGYVASSLYFYKGSIEDIGRLEEQTGSVWSLNFPLPGFFRRTPLLGFSDGFPRAAALHAPSCALRAGEGLALLFFADEVSHVLASKVEMDLVWDFEWWSTRRST